MAISEIMQLQEWMTTLNNDHADAMDLIDLPLSSLKAITQELQNKITTELNSKAQQQLEAKLDKELIENLNKYLEEEKKIQYPSIQSICQLQSSILQIDLPSEGLARKLKLLNEQQLLTISKQTEENKKLQTFISTLQNKKYRNASSQTS